jgi:prephenate dehydrogenase
MKIGIVGIGGIGGILAESWQRNMKILESMKSSSSSVVNI